MRLIKYEMTLRRKKNLSKNYEMTLIKFVSIIIIIISIKYVLLPFPKESHKRCLQKNLTITKLAFGLPRHWCVLVIGGSLETLKHLNVE